MSAHEPGNTMIEALRRANPVPAAHTEGRRSLPSAHALFADVIAQPQRRIGGRVRRRALLIAIAVLVIALLVAGFVVVRRDRASLPLTTACYAAPSLQSPRVIVASGNDPVSACETYWANGTSAMAKIRNFDVCVLKSGVPAVFPGESGSVCRHIGLAEVSGNYRDVEAFADEVVRRVEATCIDFDSTERIIRSEIAKYRLEGWVVARDASAREGSHSCGSLSIEVDARRVTIIGFPNVSESPPSTGA